MDRLQELEEENARLRLRIRDLEAEVNYHRERANSLKTMWEAHKTTDCALKCCKEIEELVGTSDPVKAAKILRKWRKRIYGQEKNSQGR